MMRQICCSWFGPICALAVAGVFALFAWSAPAPEEKKFDAEIAVEPAKATGKEADDNLDRSLKNLKNIALSFHNFADATGGQLPGDIMDKDGKALLSWRVQILPYLDQEKLFKQFKLDEPWDSKNNIELIEKMPELFSSPRVVVKRKGYTVYQGFAGAGALFEPGKKLRFPASIPDGTSNTILAVESSMAVPWTKPADLPFDLKKDLPDFGKAYDAVPLAAICDGHVRTLNLKNISPMTLKAAITVAGGEVLGADWNE